MKVNSWSEFQPLKEVILGSTYSPDSISWIKDNELKEYMHRILEETEEDLNVFKNILEENGVNVKRPNIIHNIEESMSDKDYINFQKFGFGWPTPPINARDLNGVFGDTIVSFYPKAVSRYLESWSYYDIFLEYFNSGSEWISQPPPPFPDDIHIKEYDELHKSYILYHAANILKCGKDIFYSGITPQWPTGKGTSLGKKWMEQILGRKFRLNECNCGGHLDGKMSLIKPGLYAAWNKNFAKGTRLEKWELIKIPATNYNIPREYQDVRKKEFYKDFIKKYLTDWIGYCDESVFEVNMLSINENLIVSSGYLPEVDKQLKKYGVELIPIHFRHTYFWDGALHCITMDTIREGDQEDYFE